MTSLYGNLVIAIEQAVAAPFCTQRLVDAGARVIKVERAEGDFARHYESSVQGESAYFAWLNRGKESIALDIKSDDDHALLERMLAKADVLVQNLAPGAAGRAGLGFDELQRRHPRLIACDISGYPGGDAKAYDLLVQAESGLASITGRPEGPGRVGVSICDIAAGMYAYAGILEALIERERTGIGAHVSVSLFGAMTDWMTVPLLQHAHAGGLPKRLGLHHPTIAPYGAYSTADGEVVLAVQNEREWARLCTVVLQQPSLIADSRFSSNQNRVAARAALDEEVNRCLSRMSRREALDLLRKADVAFAAVNTVEDVWNHPQLRLGRARTETGEITLPMSVLRDSGEGTPSDLGSVTRLDDHGESIRGEFA